MKKLKLLLRTMEYITYTEKYEEISLSPTHTLFL